MGESRGSADKKMVTPAAKREAVAHLRAKFGMGERRACRVIGVDRASIRYRSRRDDDGPVREKLRELAHQRRFGCRRLHVLLRRDGINRTFDSSDNLVSWFGRRNADWTVFTSLSLRLETIKVGTVSAAVPEPGSWAMMIVGFGFAGASIRNKHRRQLATA